MYLIDGPNVTCCSDSVPSVFDKFAFFQYIKQNVTTPMCELSVDEYQRMYDLVCKEHCNLKIMVPFRPICNHK
jgi:hypothetical protein